MHKRQPIEGKWRDGKMRSSVFFSAEANSKHMLYHFLFDFCHQTSDVQWSEATPLAWIPTREGHGMEPQSVHDWHVTKWEISLRCCKPWSFWRYLLLQHKPVSPDCHREWINCPMTLLCDVHKVKEKNCHKFLQKGLQIRHGCSFSIITIIASVC